MEYLYILFFIYLLQEYYIYGSHLIKNQCMIIHYLALSLIVILANLLENIYNKSL